MAFLSLRRKCSPVPVSCSRAASVNGAGPLWGCPTSRRAARLPSRTYLAPAIATSRGGRGSFVVASAREGVRSPAQPARWTRVEPKESPT